MYYNEKHLQEWGHPRMRCEPIDLAPIICEGPTVEVKPAKAMLIVSRDLKYAESGRHPYIGSIDDHERVLAAAKSAPAVIMGYNTVLANRGRGIKCEHLYIATNDPSKVDYSLPVFKTNKPVLVTPRPGAQSYLPKDVLILGGPALIHAYIGQKMLSDIEVTVAPYFWPAGLVWRPSVKFARVGLERYNEFNEMVVDLRVVANDKN